MTIPNIFLPRKAKRLALTNIPHMMLLHLEAFIDTAHLDGRRGEEWAWNLYFCLLDECDEYGFYEDRERILEKIDLERYDPFRSSDPRVVEIAKSRSQETILE